MKFKITLLLLVLIFSMAGAGCMKDSAKADLGQGVVTPAGNFAGNFQLIHQSKTGKLDTANANVVITLTNTFTFTVSGDTTKIQYPSHGTFTQDPTNNLLTFADQTVTKTTNLNAAKKHLNGPFLYTYDNTNLHIYGSSDTLAYNYTLVKN